MNHDEFTLYDLKVEVIASDKPMVCSHKEGDYFLVIRLSKENCMKMTGCSRTA